MGLVSSKFERQAHFIGLTALSQVVGHPNSNNCQASNDCQDLGLALAKPSTSPLRHVWCWRMPT